MAQDYKELAYAVLLLERQLESYQKLHQEEMQALWKTLTELKKRVLAMAPADTDVEQTPTTASPAPDHHSSA